MAAGLQTPFDLANIAASLPSAPWYPPKPTYLARVTDDESFCKYDLFEGFKSADEAHGIDTESVVAHLNWDHDIPFKNLISLCGSDEKTLNELEWRLRHERTNVTAFQIELDEYCWKEVQFDDVSIECLTDENEVKFIFRALDLIEALGVTRNIKAAALRGARHEWLALNQIHRDNVVRAQRFISQAELDNPLFETDAYCSARVVDLVCNHDLGEITGEDTSDDTSQHSSEHLGENTSEHTSELSSEYSSD